MPICIAGMHRSGTSMIAARLHNAGLYLGAPAELMPATRDNPRGYWENLRFVALNDAVLRAYGGSWEAPPRVDPAARSWRLGWLRACCRRLLLQFDGRTPWGWKDPRNSLTLPFWLDLVPDLKVVICLRHPGDVDRSMRTRDLSRRSDGLRLWHLYNERLLAATTVEQRLVTDYDAHFRDPARELRRLLDFAGIATPVAVDDVVSPELRRSRHGVTDAASLDLYDRLSAEAS